MSAVKLTGFSGITPRTAERLLSDMAAQVAENVILSSGELRPAHAPSLVFPVAGRPASAYRAVHGGGEKWRVWDADVDVAKAPLSADVDPRYYWTGDGCPKYAPFSVFGNTQYALGIPSPAVKLSISSAGGSQSVISRTYCYTFYQPATGEESGPSPSADIGAGRPDGTWTLSGFSAAPANDRDAPYNTAGLKQRLYRTSGTAATFQLVNERDASTADWSDAYSDLAILGDDLISSGWEIPPVDLAGIIALPNGCLVGFHANELCYCEPYQPHAWPLSYRFQTESPIVGIAAVGSTVIVATQTKPYIADGQTPDVAAIDSIGDVWPCVSKRSVVSIGDGVLFATKHGMAYVGQAGASMWTQSLFTLEEWEPLNPAFMVAAATSGKVFISCRPADEAPKILVIQPGESAILTTLSLDTSEIFTVPMDGRLYVIDQGVRVLDDKTDSRLVFDWLSKEIEFLDPCNLGAAKVDFVNTLSDADNAANEAHYTADITYNVGVINSGIGLGALGEDAYGEVPIAGDALIIPTTKAFDQLTFKLYSGGVEVFSQRIVSRDAFRLPAGYKSDFVSMRLTGNVRVKSVKAAETMLGLKQL